MNESPLEKVRVWGNDGFSLAELLGYWISCRRHNVHLFLLGPVIDGSFLLVILLLGSVIDNASCN